MKLGSDSRVYHKGEPRPPGNEMLTYPPAGWLALIFLLFVECP